MWSVQNDLVDFEPWGGGTHPAMAALGSPATWAGEELGGGGAGAWSFIRFRSHRPARPGAIWRGPSHSPFSEAR